MTIKRIKKEQTLTAGAGTLTLTSDNAEPGIERLDPNKLNNFLYVISLDGPDGDPVIPTAGTYTIYVQAVPDGPWMAIADGGTLDATLTGGDAMADGVGVRASFEGGPIGVKVIADSVDVATEFRVHLIQSDEI